MSLLPAPQKGVIKVTKEQLERLKLGMNGNNDEFTEFFDGLYYAIRKDLGYSCDFKKDKETIRTMERTNKLFKK